MALYIQELHLNTCLRLGPSALVRSSGPVDTCVVSPWFPSTVYLIPNQGYVHDAVEEPSGRLVALKKSRVSQKVKRPHLQHESRILWLLQGHPAIPAIFAYGHLPHFEYIAMEFLGPSLKDCIKGPVSTKTGARVVLQMVCVILISFVLTLSHKSGAVVRFRPYTHPWYCPL